MRIVLKIGGAPLARPASRGALARAVTEARGAGHDLVVVHGGGDQIRRQAERLGLEQRYVDGLRVTDSETAAVVLATVAGSVGKTLAAALAASGTRAVSLCGADGDLFAVERHSDGALGYVGAVTEVRTEVLETLLAAGHVPLVGCVGPLAPGAPGPRDHLYNVNADDVAAPLARALEADALLFLTDVPGLLDAGGARIATVDDVGARALTRDDVLKGGMLPKARAGLAAAAANPAALVKIAPADGPHAVLAALASDVGTTFLAPAPAPSSR